MNAKSTYLLLITLCLLYSPFSFSINFKHIGSKEGLSQLSVMGIHQDQLGRMWFGTEEGLNMYDGQQVKVFKPRYKIDSHSTEGSYGILGNSNYPITEDKQGNLYFRSDESLIRFDLVGQAFTLVRKEGVSAVASDGEYVWYALQDSIFRISNNRSQLCYRLSSTLNITALHPQKQTLWVGSKSGLYTVDRQGCHTSVISSINVYSLFEDSHGRIWVATLENGAYRIDTNGTMTHYNPKKNDRHSIGSNNIRCFTEDNAGNIWVGTFKGLNKWNQADDTFTLYTANQHPESLSHSSVFSLCKDKQGNVWVGTYYGGVNHFHPEAALFQYYSGNKATCSSVETDSKHLSYPFVGSMTEDAGQNLWICTEGGGVNCFDRQAQTFRHLQISWQEGAEKVEHNNLKAICYDSLSNRLFIGTHTGGLSCYDLTRRTFKNYHLTSPTYAEQLGNVVDHLMIHKDQLIIQVRGGIYAMNLRTEQFTPLLNQKRYAQYWMRTFTIDSADNIWLAGYSHVTRINLNRPEERKVFNQGERGLGRFYITKIIEDAQHNIYIGTRGSGMFRYDASTDSFQSFTLANNKLLSDYCYDIVVSQRGTLVIIGDRGITLFNPQSEQSEFIGLKNNLPLSAINMGCKAYVCRDGTLYVGGVDGMISFREEAVYSKQQNHLYLSSLWVNNQEVYPNDEHRVLTKTLPLTQEIDLNYKQNNITLHIASTNYTTVLQSGIYEYYLQGFDDEWTPTSLTGISYTNLPPGKYTFMVREKNRNSSQPTQQTASLRICIHPAFYNTTLAHILYVLTGAGILCCFVRFYYSRMKLKATLEFERTGKERMKELNQAKTNFFTTVSHEFRTPLTLILSQTELLLQQSLLPPHAYSKMKRIYKNALAMKGLITELLNFQKLEQNFISLQVIPANLHALLSDIYLSFSDYAVCRSIDYEFHCPDNDMECWADVSQLRKVFSNLLSNAFNYTPEGGKIELIATRKENSLLIQVIDSGQGISVKDQPHIFDIFYRAGQMGENTGSGIGLSLVKKIIELHHGNVSVTSQPGYGSIFTVELRAGKAHFTPDQLSVEQQEVILQNDPVCSILPYYFPDYGAEDKATQAAAPETKSSENHYTVLIVEDNEEMLQILHTLFAPIYHVLLAHNGKEGLKLAQEQQPHLILSDIMMPEMSGKELCTRIKENIDLCHIPVVLLTALHSDEDKLEGLVLRADDYVSKPFHARHLITRCNNLIYSREQLQKKYSNQETNTPSYLLATNPLDQKFLKRVDEVIAAHLDQEEFDINCLTREIGIGRSSFYTKFKALLAISPNEYLMNYRLRQAAQLLKNHPEWQVTEVSDRVGFSSSRYFTKCFKLLFQMTPMEYKKSTTQHPAASSEDSNPNNERS